LNILRRKSQNVQIYPQHIYWKISYKSFSIKFVECAGINIIKKYLKKCIIFISEGSKSALLIRTRSQNFKALSFLDTFKQESHLNNTQKFSYFLTVNSLHHYYKHQSVNSIQGKTVDASSENHTNPINTLYVYKAKVFKIETGYTYFSHSDVQDFGKYVGVRDQLQFL